MRRQPLVIAPSILSADFARLGEEVRAVDQAGADIITVHAEAGPHLHRSLQAIRALGKKAGVALNPATPVSAVEHVIGDIDLLLIMSVNPGFGGQSFIPESVAKLKQAKALIGRRKIDLEVDGGINAETAPLVVEAGANVIVAGSGVFKGGAYQENIAAIRAASLRARIAAA